MLPSQWISKARPLPPPNPSQVLCLQIHQCFLKQLNMQVQLRFFTYPDWISVQLIQLPSFFGLYYLSPLVCTTEYSCLKNQQALEKKTIWQ